MKLSIGMMVKNEEKNLERCLDSLKPIRDAIESELIIVDTGSTDQTDTIAQKYTNQVYFHQWNNNFAEMRNTTISYAQGEWFFVVDADEEVGNQQAIIDFFQSGECDKVNAAVMFVHNYTFEGQERFSSLLSPRLFRKTSKFYYTGAIHHQPNFEGKIAEVKAIIHHYGYVSTDPELMERKFKRTSAILKAELEKDPSNIYYWFQLSVSYSMHQDHLEALRYIEKAYELFLAQGKPVNFRYIYTHMALVNQVLGNYQRVEEVCEECMSATDEYIDIVYYLAEAKAVLHKNEEAIALYHQYLQKLDRYYDVQVKDAAVIDYTLNNRQYAYYNLCNLYVREEKYDKAFEYADILADNKLLADNLGKSVLICIKLGKYEQLKCWRDKWNDIIGKDNFYAAIEENKQAFDVSIKLEIVREFAAEDDYYGLLNNMLFEDAAGALSEETIDRTNNLDWAALPLYCSDILYLLLKYQRPINAVGGHFKEIWLQTAFEYLQKRHEDVSEVLYEYLQSNQSGGSLTDCKLSKMFSRILLLVYQLSEEQFYNIWNRYLDDGISYIQMVYQEHILQEEYIYELKNDEEVFLLYMNKAIENQKKNTAIYVSYLRQALSAFPAMSQGIERLLDEINVAELTNGVTEEFSSYQKQIKASIKQLIEVGDFEAAKQIINEYKAIVLNDMEIIVFESEILLKASMNNMLMH